MTNQFFPNQVSERAVAFAEGSLSPVEASAVIAIYYSWIAHCSPIARAERISPEAIIDHLTLFRSAADAFVGSNLELVDFNTACCPSVINLNLANDFLISEAADKQTTAFENGFLVHSIRNSQHSSGKQDMYCYCRLFRSALHLFSPLEIASGELLVSYGSNGCINLDSIVMEFW